MFLNYFYIVMIYNKKAIIFIIQNFKLLLLISMLFNFLFLFVNESVLIFLNTKIVHFEKKVHHLKPLLISIIHHINLKIPLIKN